MHEAEIDGAVRMPYEMNMSLDLFNILRAALLSCEKSGLCMKNILKGRPTKYKTDSMSTWKIKFRKI